MALSPTAPARGPAARDPLAARDPAARALRAVPGTVLAHGDRGRRTPGLFAIGDPGPVLEELLAPDEEVVAGRRPVEEAFAAHREALRLLVVPERRAALEQLVLHATTLRIPVVEVEGGTLTAISGFDGHQGVALVVAPGTRRRSTRSWPSPGPAASRPSCSSSTTSRTPRTSAPCCARRRHRASTASSSRRTARRPSARRPSRARPARSSTWRLVTVPDLAAGLADLHARGLRIVGADGDAPLTVREVDLRGPLAIVVGNEGRGLTSRLRRRVDVMARIPMRGQVASLNASVAGSIFLYEAAAQRGLPETMAAPAPARCEGAPAADLPPAAEAAPAADPAPAAEPAPAERASVGNVRHQTEAGRPWRIDREAIEGLADQRWTR